jgi:Fe-S-cluster containining protein
MKIGRRLIASGLRGVPSRSELAAVALVEAEALGDATEPRPATSAARIAHQVFEASLRASRPSLALACRKGCSHCCHAFVGATAPEIFLIADVIERQRPSRVESVIERANATANLGIAERIGRKLPCTLLVEGACSVYAARPTVCRKTTSTRVEDCIDEFEGRALDQDITMSKVHVDHAWQSRLVLVAALTARGLPTTAYELGAGLRTVLQTPDAERTWLAGGDVFAGLEAVPSESRDFVSAVRTLATDVTELMS